MTFSSARKSAICLPPSPSSLTILPAARRRPADAQDLFFRARRTDLIGSQAEVGGGVFFDLFFLRRHDALELRIARLIDAARDGDKRGQFGFADIVARQALALDRDLLAVDRDLFRERERGNAEKPGELSRDDAGIAVAALARAQDEIGI